MKIAILGLGTIGYGVYDIISKQCPNLEVKKVFDKRKDILPDLITNDLNEILNDQEIEVVVETMGGLDFAYDCIKKCLNAKKNVVTANKEVIAKYLDELTIIKENNNVKLMFEASVGGGIPIITNLIDIVKVNKVSKIEGIINGTTNYILTLLSQGKTFDEALKKAQENGFAEADPTSDLEGLDMLRKIAILGMISNNKTIDLQDIYHYGIGNVNTTDIDYLKKEGYILKYMASYEHDYLSVEPVAVPIDSIFANIQYEYNIISVESENYDTLQFIGRGAGRYPTANAIINDIYKLQEDNYCFVNNGKLEVLKDNRIQSFYIRKNNKLEIIRNVKREDIDFNNVSFYARIWR